MHSESSAVGRMAKGNQEGDVNLLRQFSEEPIGEVAPNLSMTLAMKRLLEEHQNDMGNYIVSCTLDVIMQIVPNAVNNTVKAEIVQ